MQHEKQAIMPYDFTDFMGNVWPAAYVNAYNNYLPDINKSAGIDILPGSLTEKERTTYLNRRHDFFTTTMGALADLNTDKQEG